MALMAIGVGCNSRATVEDVAGIIIEAVYVMAGLDPAIRIRRHREGGFAARGDPEAPSTADVAPGLLRYARNDGASDFAHYTLSLDPRLMGRHDCVASALNRGKIDETVRMAAMQLGLRAVFLGAEELKAVASRCQTHSERSMRVYAVPSVAEAAALAAAGPGSKLVLPRIVKGNATAAIAISE